MVNLCDKKLGIWDINYFIIISYLNFVSEFIVIISFYFVMGDIGFIILCINF